MTQDELICLINTNPHTQLCIFREPVPGLTYFIVSYYIAAQLDSYNYVLRVVFDPINAVDEGEGKVWISIPTSLADIITSLETHLCQPISAWQNITESGDYLFFQGTLDTQKLQEQQDKFKTILELGRLLLPRGFSW
ncbi:hypothetical protein [Zooshikella harenae]|uniref:Uncharacterized protein n=1 Tax=Zooshikella harenae TaxID=2827238 RepID=A0ABS5ZL27_9GAMM|nr:hypothetical protein [Zooshikella harenae]MBU2714045.1 hypothetical protein [Zooshikella harenae]